jgi:hypothetical protein
MQDRLFQHPLKPHSFCGSYGTAEVVPLSKSDYPYQDFILMKKGSLVMSLKMTIAANSRMQTNATW